MNLTNQQRISFLLAGAVLVGLSLFFANPYIALLISLLLMAVVLRDYKLGILYLLVFVPMRPAVTALNNGYKFLGLLLIGAVLLQILWQHRSNVKGLFRFHYFEWGYFAFCAVGVVSALTGGVGLGAIAMQLYALLLFYLLFYITSRMKVEQPDIILFAAVSVVTGVLLSLHGWVEKLSSRQWLLPHDWQMMKLAETNRIRVYGLTGGPNELALYLIVVFFLAIYLLRYVKGKQAGLLYAAMIVIQTTFWLTYSRGALLTLLVFVPVYLFLYRKVPHWKKLLLVTVSALVLFVSITKTTAYLESRDQKTAERAQQTQQVGVSRFTGALSSQEIEMSQGNGRIYYFKKALEVFKDKPVIGHGFSTYGSAATVTYGSPIYEKYQIPTTFYADNQYAVILAETGAVGMLLMLIFAIGILSIAWRLRRGHAFSPLLVYLPVAAIVGGLVYSIMENDSFTLYLFTVLGYASRFLPSKQA
ncbi:O-antigen ligase family protein [Ectobacillus ponti]|uniref:O-antigen ligase family protein n=1 Tax=Ectobacillus ponti TaxID=2961894 RepID=A0AA41X647_9BACI|nr:O-antigen ligase family protein [Ectobacillus ponti]MCP8969651.1 O-antigen ligase family protein [Ectobacillus ponti]